MTRISLRVIIGLMLFLSGCGMGKSVSKKMDEVNAESLTEFRKKLQTILVSRSEKQEAIPKPPADVFLQIKYSSPVGMLEAYVSPPPDDNHRHPAIIWITGGDCNSIGNMWRNSPRENDQTARQFREAGIIMMVPSLRGGNQNPGKREGFLGEVDDIIAALNYLRNLPYVDSDRVFLGGHSTGGTLALLASECTSAFRAVFSFGPVAVVSAYEPKYLPFDNKNPVELVARNPLTWLHCVKKPTHVFEGTARANIDSLELMKNSCKNKLVHFHAIEGGTHFNILAPLNALIAQKILKDKDLECNIGFTNEELIEAMRK